MSVTIIVACKLEDRVIFVSDRLRVKIDNQGQILSSKSTENDKIRIVRNNMAIATAGLGTLNDAAVMAIRYSITDPIDTPNYTVDEVVKCCQDHFRFLHKQFIRYNPAAYNKMVFLLRGTDTTTKAPFIYQFESDLEFEKIEVQDWIVRGSYTESQRVEEIISSQLPTIHARNDIISLMTLTNAIKSVAQHSNSVGSDCLGMMVGNFPAQYVYL